MKKLLFNSILNSITFSVDKNLSISKIKRFQHTISNRVVDIGAGDNPYKPLFRNVKSYTSTNAIRHYDNHLIQYFKPYTDIWIGNGTRLPFKSNSFDAVLCFQVLSVIDDPDLFFKEINRVLTNSGKLILTTDYLYPKWCSDDLMRHTDTNLVRLATNNNFSVECIESYGGVLTIIHHLLVHTLLGLPLKIKRTRSIKKLLTIMESLMFLLLLPAINLFGIISYIIERNRNNNLSATMNYFLVCTKNI